MLNTPLKDLILGYGKDKVNTLTKYPSILTLHEMGDKGILTDNLIYSPEDVAEMNFATEKIDGTNVRIIFWQNEFLIGSRREILYYSEDLYWDSQLNIVQQMFELNIFLDWHPNNLTVVFGELYGGKASSSSKNYGKDKYGFRVFDVAEILDLSILDKSIEEISLWRERSVGSKLSYGQSFFDIHRLDELKGGCYDLVPPIPFQLSNLSHEYILEQMRSYLPETKAALSDSAKMRPEGIVIRNADRSKIAKLRFDDYERTVRSKQQ